MPHSDFTSFFTDPVMSLIISTFKHVGLSLKDISKLQGLCGHAKVTPAIHRLTHLPRCPSVSFSVSLCLLLFWLPRPAPHAENQVQKIQVWGFFWFFWASGLCGNIVSSVPPHRPPTHLVLIYILGLSSVKEAGGGGGCGGCWKASGGGSGTSQVGHMFFFHYK